MSGFGASIAEWQHFARTLGRSTDLLPVVSDPAASVAPGSTLSSVGKVPSLLDGAGRVYGIAQWPRKTSSEAEIDRWSRDDRLGICVQTRVVRAIDIDVEDSALASRVEEAFTRELGPLPCRCRPGTGKRLLVVEVEGRVRKRSFRVDGGLVELLGDGQQFVAVGTHPSGARYAWRGGLPLSFPQVTLEELQRAWAAVGQLLAVHPTAVVGSSRGQVGGAVADFDRAATLNRASLETIEELRSAAMHLPQEDAEEYSAWISTGLALKSMAAADLDAPAREIWHEFSQRSAKYDAHQCDEKWEGFDPTQIDFRAIFARAGKAGWVSPLQKPAGEASEDCTEAGSLDVLARLVRGDLRYVYERKLWLWWDGFRWLEDTAGAAAQRVALAVAEDFRQRAFAKWQEARKTSDAAAKKAAEKLQAWFNSCRSRKVITNVLALATADERFVISVKSLNTDPWLLGVDNGVVDLRCGSLRAEAREDYVTMRCPIPYDPQAQAPRWRSFVDEVTSRPESGVPVRRADLAEYVQRFLGYCATGLTREHKLFLCIGDGANGKNVLFDTLQHVMGPYCQAVPPEVLAATQAQGDAERPSPVLAGLAGSRLAVCSESRDGQQLDVSLVKRHTGGGHLKARYLREDSFQFEITHKLVMMTNHQPYLDRIDEAVRGRLHLVPFDMRWNRPDHPARDPKLPDGDKELLDKLKVEAAGILAWIVDGAGKYAKEGLTAPDCVREYTREYLTEQDPFGRWMDECRRCDVREGTRASTLLESYLTWKAAHGEEGGPRSQSSFSKALKYAKVAKQARNDATYYGIRPPAGVRDEFGGG